MPPASEASVPSAADETTELSDYLHAACRWEEILLCCVAIVTFLFVFVILFYFFYFLFIALLGLARIVSLYPLSQNNPGASACCLFERKER